MKPHSTERHTGTTPANADTGFTPVRIALVAACLVMWSSAFAGVRAAAPAFTAGPMALLRFLAAAICALTFLIVTRAGLPQRADLPLIIAAGLIGFALYHPLFNEVERSVQAGAAAAVIAAAPIFTALLSRLFLHERLHPLAYVGIGLSFAGVVVISFAGSGIAQFHPRTLLLLICAAATATYTVMQKPLLGRYGSIRLVSYMLLAGTIPLLAWTPQLLAQLPAAPASSIIAVIYMGIFPAFAAYALWAAVLTHVPATRLAVFLNVQPLLAVVIAWIWLQERPHPLVYWGGALSIVGVLLVQKSSTSQATPARRSGHVAVAQSLEKATGTREK